MSFDPISAWKTAAKILGVAKRLDVVLLLLALVLAYAAFEYERRYESLGQSAILALSVWAVLALLAALVSRWRHATDGWKVHVIASFFALVLFVLVGPVWLFLSVPTAHLAAAIWLYLGKEASNEENRAA